MQKSIKIQSLGGFLPSLSHVSTAHTLKSISAAEVPAIHELRIAFWNQARIAV
jgi:hypothetical protein